MKSVQIHPLRIRTRKPAVASGKPIVYWMSREMRLQDNWALLYAQQLALKEKQPLVIIYNLDTGFLGGGDRQVWFKIGGLQELLDDAKKLHIPFCVTQQPGVGGVLALAKDISASTIVTDFTPLRIVEGWTTDLIKKFNGGIYQVDAHNIIPVWVASPKQEFAARTIRPKIHKLLPEWLDDIPSIVKHPVKFTLPKKWQADLPKVATGQLGFMPGEKAAHQQLKHFLKGIRGYAELRNDPNLKAVSNLSPYLHYGMISPQRVAYEVQKIGKHTNDVEVFLEELIVRRELADNYCFYNPHYDTFAGFPEWAQKTLNEHRKDKRDFVYDLATWEAAETHDALWNACQREMMQTGKMHGYMRMYWAKKILEWSKDPESAQHIAIYLNDKYELDGRDPNGYVGIAWSIGGVHDRPWFGRSVFGTVRYMAESGCRKKFDVDAYIRSVTQPTLL